MTGLVLTAGLAWALPSIDEPARTGSSAPDDAAVVVGLEDYAFIPDVPYATRDADAVADFLLYTRGVPQARIHRPRGGSREQILQAVDAAAAEVGRKGTLWIYFAGHGAASPSTGERMLLGDDVRADPAVFEARAVRVSELEERTGRKGVKTLMLLDTCYSGRGRSGADLVAGTRFAVPTYATRAAADQATWTAAGPDELSGPLDAARHGAFTYFAVGAMRGWADGELDGKRDGVVTSEEAQAYVARSIRGASTTRQTPMFTGKGTWTLTTGVSETGGESDPDASVAVAPPPPAPPPAPGRDIGPIVAQLRAGQRPESLPPTGFEPPAAVTSFLDNDLQITVARGSRLPLFHLELAVRLTDREDPSGKEGVGRALLEILEHDEALQQALAPLGVVIDVHTRQDSYRLSVSGLARSFEPAVQALARSLTSKPDASQVARWRDRAVADLERELGNPTSLAARVSKLVTAPGARALTVGKLRRLKTSDVVAHREQWLGPQNTAIFVAGGVTEGEAQQVLERHLGGWRPSSRTSGRASATLQAAPGIWLVDTDTDIVAIFAVTPIAGRRSEDYAPFAVARSALGSQGGRIDGARCHDNLFDGGALFYCWTSARVGGAADALAEMRRELVQVRRERVLDEGEVTRSRDELLNDYKKVYDYLAAIPGELADSWLHGVPGAWQAEYLAGLQGVTAYDANRAFEDAVEPDDLAWVVAGPADALEGPLGELGLPVRVIDAQGR